MMRRRRLTGRGRTSQAIILWATFTLTKHVQANPLTVCSRMDVEVRHQEAGVVGVNPSITNTDTRNTTRFNLGTHHKASLLRANQRETNIYLAQQKMARPPTDWHCSKQAHISRDSLTKRVLANKATKVNPSRSSS